MLSLLTLAYWCIKTLALDLMLVMVRPLRDIASFGDENIVETKYAKRFVSSGRLSIFDFTWLIKHDQRAAKQNMKI